MSVKKGKIKRSRKGGSMDIKKLLVISVSVIVLTLFVYTFVDQQISLSKKSREIEELTEKITAASEETEKLRQEVENLSDPEYIEKVARERLGLVRPNERVFVDSNKSEDNNR